MFNDPQVLNSSLDTTDKPNTSGSRVSVFFGILFIGVLLGLPSGITSWFDGLPWTGSMETIVLSVVVPFLLQFFATLYYILIGQNDWSLLTNFSGENILRFESQNF